MRCTSFEQRFYYCCVSFQCCLVHRRVVKLILRAPCCPVLEQALDYGHVSIASSYVQGRPA